MCGLGFASAWSAASTTAARPPPGLARRPGRALGGLEPELLVVRVRGVVEVALVAPDLGDLVQEAAGRRSVQTSTIIPSCFLPEVRSSGRNIPSRAWAKRYVALPCPGWPRDGSSRVHRHVAVRVAGRALDDRQVDVERGDAVRVATRSAVALGVAEGGADLSGGSVMSGVSVGAAVDGAAVGVADGPGSAVTGVVYVNSPAARSVPRGR